MTDPRQSPLGDHPICPRCGCAFCAHAFESWQKLTPPERAMCNRVVNVRRRARFGYMIAFAIGGAIGLIVGVT